MKGSVALLTPPSRTHRTAEENLGIGYLAATLRRSGYRVEIIDGWLSGLDHDEIVAQTTAISDLVLVGISSYRSALEESVRLARDIKDRASIPVIAGGFGPTFFKEDYLRSGFDYVLRGEAEEALVVLVEKIKSGSPLEMVPGVSFMRNGEVIEGNSPRCVESLDSLPFPARDTLPATIQLKNPISISTSRGCLGNCLFCAVSAFSREHRQQKHWRERSISSIVSELQYLNQQFGAVCFKFVDDSFLEPPRNEQWAIKFAEELRSRDLRITFRTQVRADRLSRRLVEILSSCGWFATSLGVENWSPSALKRMNKSASIMDNEAALHHLEQNRVFVQMGMILFDWDTTLDELRENLDALGRFSWPITKGIFTETYVSSGTPNEQLLLKRDDVLKKRSTLGHLEYRPRLDIVRVVYEALRLWHKSHSEIYDRAINPISAPKAIEERWYREYHRLCRNLYSMDLVFFQKILELAESGRVKDILPTTEEEILRSQGQYARIEKEILVLDKNCGIRYEAFPNPFLGDI